MQQQRIVCHTYLDREWQQQNYLQEHFFVFFFSTTRNNDGIAACLSRWHLDLLTTWQLFYLAR